MKFIYYLIAIIVWLVSFLFDVLPLGYYQGSPLWTRLTYSFAHVGFLHLVLNLVVIDILLQGLRRYLIPDLMFPIALLGAILASFGSELALPTLGGSGIAYFLMGAMFALNYSKRTFIWVGVIILMNLLVLHRIHSNTAVHLLAGCYGMLFGVALLIRSLIREFKKNIA
jgi:membrane associated rhomboid family serine protease